MFERLIRYGLQDSVVVLSDFFVDRIVKFDSKSKFLDVINYKTGLGGGSIRGIQTFYIKSGNAANVAYCLAKFGLPVTLFTIANEIGSSVLQKIFSKFEKNADLRIENGKHGVTTSLEFKDENSISNIMMSDIGDIETFGPDKINHEEDLKKIFSTKCVILTNWASNLKGTELANHVFRNNENECDSLTRALGFGSILSSEPTNTDLIKKAARIISDKFGIEVDLHTRIGAAWSNGKEV